MGAHMDGREGLRIALQSHGPLDAMTLMLGTNDVKTRFGATPEMVTAASPPSSTSRRGSRCRRATAASTSS
jgi:lysophospholipase L1-like esterase